MLHNKMIIPDLVALFVALLSVTVEVLIHYNMVLKYYSSPPLLTC